MRMPKKILLLTAWLIATAAQAQDVKDVLKVLPEDSFGVVITQKLEQIDDKIQLVAKKLQMPLPLSPLELGKAAVGVSKGLNAKGAAAVAFVPQTGEDHPVPVVFVPVSDYAEFVTQFKGKDGGVTDIELVDGRKMAATKKGSFAVLVPSEHREVLKKIETASVWAEPVLAWVEENEVTLLATRKGIKHAMAEAQKGLAQAKQGLANNPEQEMAAAWLGSMENCLKSVASDVTNAGLGTRVDKDGNIGLDARSFFAKGSDLAKMMSDVKAPAGGPLAGLPTGQYAFAFGGAMPKNFMEAMLKLNLQIIKAAAKDGDNAQLKEKFAAMEKSFAEMSRNLTSMGFVVHTGAKDDPLFSNVVGVIGSENAHAYMDSYEKMVPAMNALYKDLKAPFLPEVVLKKKSLEKLTVLETETAIPLPNDGDPMQKKMLESMFGPGGKLKTSVMALDPKTIVMTYQDADSMKRYILAISANKGLMYNANVAKTLQLLPEGSQWVILINPSGVATMVSQAVANFAPGVPFQIPEFPQTPPVGIGIRATETGIQGQMVVPIQILEAAGKLFGAKGI